MPDLGMEPFTKFGPSSDGGSMTLPDPHLPLNPGHVLDDPPEDGAPAADGDESTDTDTGPGAEPEG
jgi:hypothetical protein